MEFLVRLKDKINIQVFCLNPVHKGNHMDRVAYKDDTFVAACPDCGSGDWLYRKNNAVSKKGHFITFNEDGWNWGRNELKHYGIVHINCTYEQAQKWCAGIKDDVGITYRPRKYVLDFEQVLTNEQKANWNDEDAVSDIITLSEQDKTEIKEI
jgi:hypothetical protein